MFDPAAWFVLPDGAGIPRDAMKPCPCGNDVFEIRNHVYRNRKEGTSHRADIAVCPRCVKREVDDRILGTLNLTQERRRPA